MLLLFAGLVLSDLALAERPEPVLSLSMAQYPDLALAHHTNTGPGQANLSWPDGAGYSGGFSGGQFSGDGTLVYLVGDYQAKYEGRWRRGSPVLSYPRDISFDNPSAARQWDLLLRGRQNI